MATQRAHITWNTWSRWGKILTPTAPHPNDISTRNPAHLTGPAGFLNSGSQTQLSYISRWGDDQFCEMAVRLFEHSWTGSLSTSGQVLINFAFESGSIESESREDVVERSSFPVVGGGADENDRKIA